VQSGIDPEKLWVVPNGTDLVTPDNPLVAPQPARLPTGRAGGPLSVLFVGGGIFRKGVDVLVKALDNLPDDLLRNVRLTIKEGGHDSYYAGQSLVSSSLEKAPRVAAVTTVVRQHLKRPQLVQLMLSSDVLVHPYRGEGFALPVIEAMALGLPVVVTKGGATDDFCGPDEATLVGSKLSVSTTPFIGDLLTADFPYFLVPDEDQLTAVLAELVRGDLDLGSKCNAAWQRSRQYSWQNVARTAMHAINAMVNGHGAQDTYSALSRAVTHFLRDPLDVQCTALCDQLLQVGDYKSATQVLRLAPMANPEGPSIAALLGRLQKATASLPDQWSGAPWRLELTTRLRDQGPVATAVHHHEGDREATLAIAKSIAPYFANCSSVLDIGCGQGSMLRTLRALGKTVIGVEGDPDLVRQLRDEGFDIREGWVPQVLDELGDLSTDGVFMGHIIEHLSTQDAQKTLGWAADHINDNGVIVVQTPDFSVDFVAKTNFWLDPTNVRPYPIALLKSLLESAGFSPLSGGCRPLGPVAPLDVIAVGKSRRAKAQPKHSSAPAKRHPRLAHFGLFSTDSGMGRASRGLLDLEKLKSADVEVLRIDVTANEALTLPPGTFHLREAIDITSDIAVIDVPVGWLPEILPKVRARVRVSRLAFEASPLPTYLVPALKQLDQVWAMSRYVGDVCIISGVVQGRVRLVPSSLTPTWQASKQAVDRHARGAPFTFSSVFNFEPRKNPEALIRAFDALLGRGHEARLLVKTSGIQAGHFWEWAEGVVGQNHLSRLKKACRLVDSPLSEQELRDLLGSSDVFVLPTRGEGFGLPFLEAMSLGVPSICPDIGGHRDFCDEGTSWLVPTKSVPCAATWPIALFRESRWREVDDLALVEAMERAATDADERAKKAHASLLRSEELRGATNPTTSLVLGLLFDSQSPSVANG